MKGLSLAILLIAAIWGFSQLPTADVDPALSCAKDSATGQDRPPCVFKSGLRIAVEGRLRWLGLRGW
jgi:hypothetical protein